MPFPEALKSVIRRKADMRCCVCHAIGVEVHHIVPEGEGGPSTEDNAAPVCPSCHETYGANPTKRKFIREARDNWFRACSNRTSDAAFGELIALASKGATREDLDQMRAQLLADLTAAFCDNKNAPADSSRTLGNVLKFFLDYKADTVKVRPADVDFLYDFVWDGAVDEGEVDATKIEFLNQFGKQTARALCNYHLDCHPYALSKDGFTESEIGSLVHLLMLDMTLLLHDHSVTTHPELRLSLGITPDGQLHARLAKFEPLAAERAD